MHGRGTLRLLVRDIIFTTIILVPTPRRRMWWTSRPTQHTTTTGQLLIILSHLLAADCEEDIFLVLRWPTQILGQNTGIKSALDIREGGNSGK